VSQQREGRAESSFGQACRFQRQAHLGKGDLWITEDTITSQGRPAYTGSIMEFRDGKVVHEAQYFADLLRRQRGEANGVQRIA
jgi:hypothetical protein